MSARSVRLEGPALLEFGSGKPPASAYAVYGRRRKVGPTAAAEAELGFVSNTKRGGRWTIWSPERVAHPRTTGTRHEAVDILRWLEEAARLTRRAECTRRQVGAVLVEGGIPIGRGWNAGPPGEEGCLQGGCPRGLLSHEELEGYAPYVGAGTCIAIHAEDAALRDAGLSREERRRERVQIPGREWRTMYVSCAPCELCEELLYQTVELVVWPEGYWAPGLGRGRGAGGTT